MKRKPGVPGRTPALSALLAGVTLLAAACGGNDDNNGPQAEELVPDLEDMGMSVQQEGSVEENLNTYRVIFASDDGTDGVLTDIRVMDSVEAAEAEYEQLREALRNPPEVFFGAEAEQAETDAIAQGDEQTAYVTAEPDSSGNRVWTDLYREGSVLLITQTLSADEAAAMETRGAVAERILGNVEE